MIHLDVHTKEQVDSSKLTVWQSLRLLVRLQRYALPYWDKILLRLIAVQITAAMAVVPALLTIRLIDVAFPTGDFPMVIQTAVLAVVAMLVMQFMNLIAAADRSDQQAFPGNIMSAYTMGRIALRFKVHLYRHMQNLSMDFFARRPVGEHMFRCTQDLDDAAYISSEVIPKVLAAIQRVTFLVLLFAAKFEAWILLPAFGYLAILFAVKHMITTRFRFWDRLYRVEYQRLEAVLREILFSYRLVKSYGRERTARRWFISQACGVVLADFARLLFTTFDLLFTVTMMPTYLAVLTFFIGSMVLGKTLTVGEFTAICLPGVGLMPQFIAPFQEAITTFQVIRQRLVPAERMLETLDVEPEVVDAPDARVLRGAEGKIELRNVSFSYTKGIPVLKNVSLVAHPGEKVALVGPIGAGKSTLCALLLRLYDPSEGQLLFDDVPYMDITQESLRAHMSIVMQSINTFSESIEQNIRYGKPTASRDEVIRAAKIAHVDEFASAMPKGYATMLSEGGGISGGQKQRLCLARALVRDAKVLILDEATSALDPITEKEVVDNLDKAFGDRTRIIVAHNVINARTAQRIYVFDNGCVVEVGTHDELMEANGFYKNLWTGEQRQADS